MYVIDSIEDRLRYKIGSYVLQIEALEMENERLRKEVEKLRAEAPKGKKQKKD